jgi:hypothetical protein
MIPVGLNLKRVAAGIYLLNPEKARTATKMNAGGNVFPYSAVR